MLLQQTDIKNLSIFLKRLLIKVRHVILFLKLFIYLFKLHRSRLLKKIKVETLHFPLNHFSLNISKISYFKVMHFSSQL